MVTQLLERKDFISKFAQRLYESQKQYPALFKTLSDDPDLATVVVGFTMYDELYAKNPQNINFLPYIKLLNDILSKHKTLNSDLLMQEIQIRQAKKANSFNTNN